MMNILSFRGAYSQETRSLSVPLVDPIYLDVMRTNWHRNFMTLFGVSSENLMTASLFTHRMEADPPVELILVSGLRARSVLKNDLILITNTRSAKVSWTTLWPRRLPNRLITSG